MLWDKRRRLGKRPGEPLVTPEGEPDDNRADWRPIAEAPRDKPVIVTQRGTGRMTFAYFDPCYAKPNCGGWVLQTGNWAPTHFVLAPLPYLAAWWTFCHQCDPASWFCLHVCCLFEAVDIEALLGIGRAFAVPFH